MSDVKETPGPIEGLKTLDWFMNVRADAKVVTCCGCGFLVDQRNPRCFVMYPDEYMGTYGPCCAPPKRRQDAWHRREERRRAKEAALAVVPEPSD